MNDPDLTPAIKKLSSRSDLSPAEIELAFEAILGGTVNDASVAAFLVALTMKGPTSAELRSMIEVTRRHAVRITPEVSGRLVDACGTGGDSIKSFNISTASAIVASAAGAKVAKHGNRSVSGICGSADFLEYVGLALDTPPERVQKCIEDIGIGFLFAPVFHPSMKRVAGVRKAIGMRTAFNMIGPLCNPCTNLAGQVIGVFEPALLELFADAYQGYIKSAMIVHAADGFDELSNTCENDILWLTEGTPLKRLRIHPRVLGLSSARPENLVVSSREESISSTIQVLYSKGSREKEDIVVLNASAALVVGGIAADLKDGLQLARDAIKSGKAGEKLSQLVSYSGDPDKLRAAEREFL